MTNTASSYKTNTSSSFSLRAILLIVISGVLTLVSCSSEDPNSEIIPSNIKPCEMKFDVSSISRATTSFANITEQPFAIFGDMSPVQSSGNPTGKTIIYNNAPVTFNGTAWTTQSTQYWFENHEHSFVAIHPAGVLSSENADVEYSNSQLSFSYTLPADNSQIHDILASTHRRKYNDHRKYDEAGNVTGGTAEVVQLQFAHILTMINVAPAYDDNTKKGEDYIEFHKMELLGHSTKATFRITPASLLSADQTDDKVFFMDGHEGAGHLTIEFAEPKKILNNKSNIALLDNNSALIMLPQNFVADSEAKIILYYTVGNNTEPKQASLPLKNQKWESGKNYTYNFTIGENGPLFQATTITDWEILNVGDINAH